MITTIFPPYYRKLITLPTKPVALSGTQVKSSELSEILTNVTEQNQNRAFPHSTAVLQQVQILQRAQTQTLNTYLDRKKA